MIRKIRSNKPNIYIHIKNCIYDLNVLMCCGHKRPKVQKLKDVLSKKLV